MPEKSSPALKTLPTYDLPSPAALESIGSPVSLVETFSLCHTGLTKFWIDVVYRDRKSGEKTEQPQFQQWEIANGGKGLAPGHSAEQLAKIVYLFGQQCAISIATRINFRVWIYFISDKGKTERESKSFTIDGAELAAKASATEPSPRTDRPAVDTSGLRRLTAGAIVEDPDADTPRVPPVVPDPIPTDGIPSHLIPLVQPLLALVQQGVQAPTAVIHQVTAVLEQLRLNSSKSVHDASALTRDLVERTSVAMTGVMQESSLSAARVLAESTRNQEVLRDTFREAITAVRDAGTRQVDMANDALQHERDMNRSLLRRISELESQQADLSAKITLGDESAGAKRIAWGAFERAMEMQLGVESQVRERVREELAAIATVAPTPAAGSAPADPNEGWGAKIYDDFKPALFFGMAALMKRIGGKEISDAMMGAMSESDDDGDDDDNDDDRDDDDDPEEETPKSARVTVTSSTRATPQPTPTPKTAPAAAKPAPQRPASRPQFDETTIHGKLGALVATIGDEQRETLVKIVGKKAWDAISNAARAKDDATATMLLMPLVGSIQMDPGLEQKVRAQLNPRQLHLFSWVVTTLRQQFGGASRATPSRPPSRPASAAQ